MSNDFPSLLNGFSFQNSNISCPISWWFCLEKSLIKQDMTDETSPSLMLKPYDTSWLPSCSRGGTIRDPSQALAHPLYWKFFSKSSPTNSNQLLLLCLQLFPLITWKMFRLINPVMFSLLIVNMWICWSILCFVFYRMTYIFNPVKFLKWSCCNYVYQPIKYKKIAPRKILCSKYNLSCQDFVSETTLSWFCSNMRNKMIPCFWFQDKEAASILWKYPILRHDFCKQVELSLRNESKSKLQAIIWNGITPGSTINSSTHSFRI